MATTAATHCPSCGHDNNPRYNFCGLCGTGLRGGTLPAPQSKPSESAPLSLGGYSILGLAQEPVHATPVPAVPQNSERSDDAEHDAEQNDLLNRNLDYLFEGEENRPPHWRMYVALALLVIAAATLVWQWQRNGYPWDNLAPSTTGRYNGVSPAVAAQSAPAAVPATPQTLPAPAALETGAKPAPSSVSESPNPESPRPDLSTPDAPASGSQKVPQLQTASQKQGSSATILPSEAVESGAVKSHAAAASAEPAAESPESSASAPEAGLAEASSPVEAARLFAEGTKYLLGNGVEQDCVRANKDLRAAARFSSDAEGTLGTMYASGHCVSRDLPTAYRWYARALRGRPGNSRIQDDLTALWNQMTPGEKQAASHGEP